MIHAYFNLEDPLSFFGKVLHLIGAMLEKLNRLGFSLGVTGKYLIVKQMLCTFCRHFGLLCSNFLDSTLCQYTAIMYLFSNMPSRPCMQSGHVYYILNISLWDFLKFPSVSLALLNLMVLHMHISNICYFASTLISVCDTTHFDDLF